MLAITLPAPRLDIHRGSHEHLHQEDLVLIQIMNFLVESSDASYEICARNGRTETRHDSRIA
jgi:hypothetical protein